MVTTNCKELTGKGNCTVPLSGNTAQELQKNVIQHAQQHHAKELETMTPSEQTQMAQKILQTFNQKSQATAARS